jgi:hypothetical protein
MSAFGQKVSKNFSKIIKYEIWWRSFEVGLELWHVDSGRTDTHGEVICWRVLWQFVNARWIVLCIISYTFIGCGMCLERNEHLLTKYLLELDKTRV